MNKCVIMMNMPCIIVEMILMTMKMAMIRRAVKRWLWWMVTCDSRNSLIPPTSQSATPLCWLQDCALTQHEFNSNITVDYKSTISWLPNAIQLKKVDVSAISLRTRKQTADVSRKSSSKRSIPITWKPSPASLDFLWQLQQIRQRA